MHDERPIIIGFTIMFNLILDFLMIAWNHCAEFFAIFAWLFPLKQRNFSFGKKHCKECKCEKCTKESHDKLEDDEADKGE